MNDATSLADLMRQSMAVSPTVSRDHIARAARAYLDSYPTMDIEARAALFAENAVFEDPVGARPLRGKAEIVAFWQQGKEAGWSVHHALHRIVVTGQEAMLTFVTTLSLPNVGATEMEVFENLAFDDEGKIVHLRAFFDASCVEPESRKAERNKALARDFFRALSTSDIPAIVDAYADDGYVQTMGNTLISGVFNKQQVREAAKLVLDAFPQGIRFEIRAMAAEGDLVAVEAEGFAVHASGKRYDNKYHFLMRFRDGKLLAFKEYMDTELVTEILCGGQRRAS